MCDLPEEEFVDYLLWREANRARAVSASHATRDATPTELPQRIPPIAVEA